MKDILELQLDTSPSKSDEITSCGSLPISRFDSMNSIDEEVYQKLQQKIVDTSKIYSNILNIIERLIQKTNLDQDLILLLLQKYKWDIEKLENSYFDSENPQQWSQKLEIKRRQMMLANTEKCLVCEQIKEIRYTSCGHGACLECWRQYFEIQMQSKVFFKCINGQCSAPVYHSFVLQTLQNTNNYIRKLALNYADTAKTISACPGPNCDLFFQDTSLLGKDIHCSCGTRYCFKCKSETHQPVSCKQREQWLSLTMSQKPNQTWIKVNTKQCPGCLKHIQKSLGCNLMLCRCGVSFCYACQKLWDQLHKDHFKCPFVAIEVQASQNQQRNNKITSIYSQFLELKCLQNKAVKQCKLSDDIRKLLEQKLQITEQDTLFLKQLSRAILKGYSYLKWGSVLWYLKKETNELEYLLEFRYEKVMDQLEHSANMVKQLKQKIVAKYNEETNKLQDKALVMKMFYSSKQIIQKTTKQIISAINQFVNDIKNID